VHNTLAVEDADQSVIAGPFNWRRHARTRVVKQTTATVSGEHDGYLRRFGLVHRRSISFERGALVIEDRLIGRPSKTPLHWSIGLLLGPNVLTQLAGARAKIKTKSGRLLHFDLGNSNLRWTKMQGAHSPAFNSRQTLDRLRVAGTLDGAPHQSNRVEITITPLLSGHGPAA
jgi:hypothetical protein